MKLDKILKEGLLPAKITGNRVEHAGIKGDPNFIYLWNEKMMTWGAKRIVSDSFPTTWNRHNAAILRVSLPDDISIERDYDQVLHCLNDPENMDQRFEEWILPFFDRLNINFNGEPTKKNLVYHVDKIDDNTWDDLVGSYRTAEKIDPKNLKMIEINKVS